MRPVARMTAQSRPFTDTIVSIKVERESVIRQVGRSLREASSGAIDATARR